jgi:hypothetical protein
MLGMLEDDFKPLEVATYTIVVVVATQFRTECPVLLSQWFMAILTTPYPYPFHKPTQSFPDCLALDDPVPTACFGPIVGIGWEGRSPFPSPHTTVRTGPYTAVHVDRCMARC